MATIKEDYVSYEVAKLLKEKGFDSEEVGCHGGFYSERCYQSGYGIITDSGQEVGIVYDDLRNADLEYDEYLRPTLQMAMKWLREKHKIHIQIWILEEKGYWFDIEKILNAQYKHKSLYSTGLENIYFESYEEAVENAIRYCLKNLI